MYGNLPLVATKPAAAITERNSTCNGVGFTPEGIDQNPVVYDLMLETVWHPPAVLANGGLNITEWLRRYTTRRYGRPSPTATKAWAALEPDVYGADSQNGPPRYSISWSPDLAVASDPARQRCGVGYAAAWLALGEAATTAGELGPAQVAAANPGLIYDLVDVGRECLCDAFEQLRALFADNYHRALSASIPVHSAVEFLAALGKAMLSLVGALDGLLGTNDNFLVGRWITSARAASSAGVPGEANLFEYNARNQLMMWGPSQTVGPNPDYAQVSTEAQRNRDMYFRRTVH